MRLFLSLGYLMSGDLAQAYATIYASGDPDQGRDYQKLLFSCACFLHWIAADLPGLAQAARRVLTTSDPSDFGESVTWSGYHLGLYYYQCNDLSAAEQELLPLVMRPHASDASCYLNSAVLLARIRQTQNRFAEARRLSMRCGVCARGPQVARVRAGFQADQRCAGAWRSQPLG
jgi:hypothetical protein